MLLEAMARHGNTDSINFSPEIVENNGKYALNTSNILYNLINSYKSHKKDDTAVFGQKYLTQGLTDIVTYLRDSTEISKVRAHNITSTLIDRLESDGFEIYKNTLVPPGDGGTALSQVVNALYHVI